MTQANVLLRHFENQGRSASQLAEELFALADKPPSDLVMWANGLNWYEKRLAEAVMEMAVEEFGAEEATEGEKRVDENNRNSISM